MAQKVAQYPAVGVVALAMVAIVLYSLWGASVMRAQHEAAYSGANTQAQVARGN